MKYLITSMGFILAMQVNAKTIAVETEITKTVVDQESCDYPKENEILTSLYEKALDACGLSKVTEMSAYTILKQTCDVHFAGWTGQIHRTGKVSASGNFVCSGVSRVVLSTGFAETGGLHMNSIDKLDLENSIKRNAYGLCCNIFENNCARVNSRGVKIISMTAPAPEMKRIGHACGSFPTEGCGEYYIAKGFSATAQVECL